ncbi:MAG: hypothetical protein CL946_05215 [Ectothiorhodospiraceae bacterium]|nr:hypothetical protein [Ectothiorhodospiraceae bacterium]
MADYLFLFYGGGTADMSADEKQTHMQEWGAWMQDLSQQGIFKGGEPLMSEGMTIRGKDKVVHDGPYPESKELVGGYIIVSADSLKKAGEIAKQCPIYITGGTVEVREISPFPG